MLEREPVAGFHQTGHNSGVLHAGIYYAPGSLKARLCTEGAPELLAYCQERGHPRPPGRQADRGGRRTSELPRLDELERRGRANGVPGLRAPARRGDRRDRAARPRRRRAALPRHRGRRLPAVAEAFARRRRAAGGEVVTGCASTAPTCSANRIRIRHAAGESRARFAVFCAGGWSDRLAVAAGGDPDPRIVPFRGAWLRLRPERRDLVRALVYPVPDPALPFLGVHFTRGTDDEVLIGPTALLAGARDAYEPAPPLRRATCATRCAWAGTYRMARRWWRTGLQRAAPRRQPPRARRRRRPLHPRAHDRRRPPRPRRRARPGARPRRQPDRRLRRLRDRARAPCPQRPLPRRHLLARARAADRDRTQMSRHEGPRHRPRRLHRHRPDPAARRRRARAGRARHRPVRRPRVRRAARRRRAARPTSATSRAEDLDGFDAVIHLAALSNDPLGDLNPDGHLRDQPPRQRARWPQAAKRGRRRRASSTRSSCSTYGAGDTRRAARRDAPPSTRSRPTASPRCSPSATSPPLADDDFSPAFLRNATAYGVSPRMRGDIVVNNLVAYAYTTGEVRMQPTARRGARSSTSRTSPARSSPRSRRRARPSTTRPSTSAATRTTTRSATSPRMVEATVPDATVTLAAGAEPRQALLPRRASPRSQRPAGFDAAVDRPARASRRCSPPTRRRGLTLDEFLSSRFQRIERIRELHGRPASSTPSCAGACRGMSSAATPRSSRCRS